MADIIFNSHDYETLLADAERLGFTQTDAEGNVTIITNGPLGNNGGWFLNIVGKLFIEEASAAERDGFWGRLRLNGDASNVPSFDPSITQYVYDVELGGWTDDGVTVAPEWVGQVGMLA